MQWNRPHPLTVVAELAQAIAQTFIPLILVLSNSSGSGGIADYAESLILVVPLGLALARWYSTRYALDDESVYLNHGIFIRSKQVLPRANVQNLSTTAPLLARLTGLVELNISDASADGDIKLRLIERAEADRLTTLLRRTSSTAELSDGTMLPPPVVSPLGESRQSPPTVKANTAAVALSAAATAGNGFIAAGSIGLWLATLNWLDAGLLGNALPTSVPPWVWALLVLALIVAGSVINVVGRVVTLGGFGLWNDPDRLRISSGLLTERQITARRERIQLIRVNRPWLMRKLGLEEVRFSTADVESPQLAAVAYLDPAAQLHEWANLAPYALGTVELTEADLNRVSPLTQRRVFVRFCALALLIGLTGLVLGSLSSSLVAATGISLAVLTVATGWWFSRARYENLGIAIGTDQILSRTGVLHEELVLMRKEKIQGVVVSSTYFQRRLGLATLSVGTAGHGGRLGGLRVPDLPSATADKLASSLASQAAQTPLERTL